MRQVHEDKCTGARASGEGRNTRPLSLRGEAYNAKSLGGRKEEEGGGGRRREEEEGGGEGGRRRKSRTITGVRKNTTKFEACLGMGWRMASKGTRKQSQFCGHNKTHSTRLTSNSDRSGALQPESHRQTRVMEPSSELTIKRAHKTAQCPRHEACGTKQQRASETNTKLCLCPLSNAFARVTLQVTRNVLCEERRRISPGPLASRMMRPNTGFPAIGHRPPCPCQID